MRRTSASTPITSRACEMALAGYFEFVRLLLLLFLVSATPVFAADPFAMVLIPEGSFIIGNTSTVDLGTLEQSTDNLNTWQAVPVTSGMLTAEGKMDVGALDSRRFYRLKTTRVLDTEVFDANATSTTVSAFYMDATEVTLSQWQTVYDWAKTNGYDFDNVGSGKNTNHPVQSVNWYDCAKWCNARSEREGRTAVYHTNTTLTGVYRTGRVDLTTSLVNWDADGYGLPTEAEWEKAARGDLVGQRFPWGATISEEQANYYGNTNRYSYDLGPDGYNPVGSVGGISPATSPVRSFAANGYGLFDMAGNVMEWCWDWYGTPYAGGTDPHGPLTGSYHVLRGGWCRGGASAARCASRFYNIPSANDSINIGLRTVRRLPTPMPSPTATPTPTQTPEPTPTPTPTPEPTATPT